MKNLFGISLLSLANTESKIKIMATIVHLSVNIQRILDNYRNKKINFIQDDNGKMLGDKVARVELKFLQSKGHKLISCSNDCIGFDPFGGGCPGHIINPENNTLLNSTL